MANNNIQQKRTSVAGRVPLASELLEGQLAINLPDKKLFTKDHTGAVVELAGGGTGSAETANTILAKLLTVDGTGSGLDADLLDGYHAAIGDIELTAVVRDANSSVQTTAIDFSLQSPVTLAPAERRLLWNDDDGTLDLGMKGGNVVLQVGQELIMMCRNGTGATIANGSVVFTSGAQGQRPSIELASNSSALTSEAVIGLATETIADESTGFVTTYGLVRNLDTSAFLEGTELWLGSTPGSVASSAPAAPARKVRIGTVVRQHASAGSIFVHVEVYPDFGQNNDVSIAGATAGQTVRYNGSIWQNYTLTKSDVGLSNVDNTADSTKSVASAATLTTARSINGTSFNGSANITTANWGTARNITIGSTTRSVDGSTTYTWSLADIGAAAASHTHPNANSTVAGFMSSTDFTKLAGIAAGATANATDAQLRDRATHTGTQAASTITGLASIATSGSASDLSTGTLPAARFTDTSHGSRGGGTLHAAANSTVAGFMSSADFTKLAGIAAGAQPGTVTSVALSLPAIFTVSGSPVTTTGTLTASLASQTAGTVFAAPTGSAGAPSFRALAVSDIPSLTASKITDFNSVSRAQIEGTLVQGTGITLSYAGTGDTRTVTISAAGGSGTVTSVAANTVGTGLTITGSPITTTGTFTFELSTNLQSWSAIAPSVKLDATHAGTGGSSHASANSTTAGFMSSTDFTKLAGIEPGAQVNTVTSVAGKTGAVTLVKADVGLSNVDNTADSVKSVASAATLTTARTINGTSFNGSANITTVNWGTARNITIGSTTRSVDGSTTYTWTLADIGAAAENHTHAVANSTVAGFMSSADFNKLAGIAAGAQPGTVTSVGLSLPAIFTVSGSPVTTTGTLTASLASQSAATVLAAPSGSAGSPSFRALTATDIPTLAVSKINSSATQRLFGRASAGAGAGEEISLGAGLAWSGSSIVSNVAASGTTGRVQLSNGSGGLISNNAIYASGTTLFAGSFNAGTGSSFAQSFLCGGEISAYNGFLNINGSLNLQLFTVDSIFNNPLVSIKAYEETAGNNPVELTSHLNSTPVNVMKVTTSSGLVTVNGSRVLTDSNTPVLGMYDYWREFAPNTVNASGNMDGDFQKTILNNGTLNLQTENSISPFGVMVRSSTDSAFSGSIWRLPNPNLRLGQGIAQSFFFDFRTPSTIDANLQTRIGFGNQAGDAGPTNGVYFRNLGNAMYGITVRASASTIDNANQITLSTNTNYYGLIEVNSAATAARFRVWSGTNLTPIYDRTLTTTIPDAAGQTVGIAVQVGRGAGFTNAADLLGFSRFGFGTQQGFYRSRGVV